MYLLVATYTLPNVPRPISFPFCHCPLIGWDSGLGVSTGCADGRLGEGRLAPGGRGNGWTSEVTDNLGCNGDDPGGLLMFRQGLLPVGLFIGELSLLNTSKVGISGADQT